MFSMLAPLIFLNDATPKQGKVAKHWPYRKAAYPLWA